MWNGIWHWKFNVKWFREASYRYHSPPGGYDPFLTIRDISGRFHNFLVLPCFPEWPSELAVKIPHPHSLKLQHLWCKRLASKYYCLDSTGHWYKGPILLKLHQHKGLSSARSLVQRSNSSQAPSAQRTLQCQVTGTKVQFFSSSISTKDSPVIG